ANRDRWEKAGKPPHNIRPVKGSVHIVASRGFVDYLLHNQTSKDLLEWVQKTKIPDETYFSTLNHNPHLGVPGSYKGEPERRTLSRFKNWGSLPCAGKFVRSVCVLGLGDLPLLAKAKEFFANKFHLDFEPYALDCIEEWHYNRTRDEYLAPTQMETGHMIITDPPASPPAPPVVAVPTADVQREPKRRKVSTAIDHSPCTIVCDKLPAKYRGATQGDFTEKSQINGPWSDSSWRQLPSRQGKYQIQGAKHSAKLYVMAERDGLF
ncbi:beta-1,3-galactosyl-O-glycosyl-glycoprotein beta-1,6-N-acetylglucosaminyltransferase-like, partial [Gigantopelta aegis]|uniref:beta-1,3-galactosyl-O-glycosyl-glycoprotein beta-1,6-N-acetylglucosaminyltransferase-like n=1 Tax=Gigantopelta aegis TaxID=1735272 RepID=UPI001B88D1E7